MKFRRLETRFLFASCLLVAATVACGIWSGLTFSRLSRVVGDSLRESQGTIDLASKVASALEREDDALLLALAGDRERAHEELAVQRQAFDEAYRRLGEILTQAEEKEVATALRGHVSAYRTAGDVMVNEANAPDARERYHRYVNPLLRSAVADCAQLRELNFRAMQTAGIQARDVASSSTKIVAIVSAIALAVSIIVSLHLARVVTRPIRELTASVDALREGDFERRVDVTTADEIGRLGDGFNRMAQALLEFRRSNLGEVLRAKGTLETILAALPDAVMVVGADEQVEAINPAAADLLRMRGAAGARALTDLGLPRPAVDAVRQALRGESVAMNLRDPASAFRVSVDGTSRRLLPIAAPVKERESGQGGAVLVLYDVSDFARLDELRSELIGVASHELKTPLTTLRMNLMLLAENVGTLADRRQEVIAAALAGCEQLANTVEELLDVTRIEAGRLRLDLERVDLRVIVSQTVEGFRHRFDDAGVRITTEADLGTAGLVRGDSARIATVLSNLLDNALKYTPAGGQVSVKISSGLNAGSGSIPVVRFAVTDTGCGISPEFRERVFDKFFRVEHERPDGLGGARGAGIGLYLCRQIVEAHGGSIRCEAAPHGPGTQIVVELPAEPVEASLESIQ
jgi:NtrC-family two-component system sensor histidine kinase KinB